jgi:hypothetical protein
MTFDTEKLRKDLDAAIKKSMNSLAAQAKADDTGETLNKRLAESFPEATSPEILPPETTGDTLTLRARIIEPSQQIHALMVDWIGDIFTQKITLRGMDDETFEKLASHFLQRANELVTTYNAVRGELFSNTQAALEGRLKSRRDEKERQAEQRRKAEQRPNVDVVLGKLGIPKPQK